MITKETYDGKSPITGNKCVIEEANEKEGGGWHLFKSVKHILKGAANHIHKGVKTVKEGTKQVGKYFAKGHQFIKPVAKAIDSFTKDAGAALGLKATQFHDFSQELLAAAKKYGPQIKEPLIKLAKKGIEKGAEKAADLAVDFAVKKAGF